MDAEYGAIVMTRGKSADADWEIGDDTEVYVLLDPLDVVHEAQTRAATGRQWNAHAAARKWGISVEQDRHAGRGREVGRHGCQCPAGRSLVIDYLDRGGRRWAIIGPERIPASFRRTSMHDPARIAMPLHRHPNGSPHVEVTTCRSCNQDWIVALTEDSIHLARCRATRGGTVAP